MELAWEHGLNASALTSGHGVEVQAGNPVAEGAEPLVLVYAGHQFGHFVSHLGVGISREGIQME